jgi:general secretion pathway protein A
LSREELFDFLIQKFGINCPSSLKSRQLSALQDTLLRNRADGRPSVLIVDEAHRLSLELLEEIRLLLNLETPREKLLQIIIAGQPELSEILRQPVLRQFKQRVSCHCKLIPLSFNQLKEYIDHRLSQAGLPRQTLFSEAVMQRIYECSGGLPRLVNSVCDAALQTAFAIRSRIVTLAIIDEVARDLDLDGTTRPEQVDMSEALLSSVTARSSNGHATRDTFETNGSGNADMAMPLESYSARQKTVNFFGNLMDRWK